jgi:hypothetical protein
LSARAALYAALVQAGANPPAGRPTVNAASSLAKRIVLAWADHGFRDDAGAFRNAEEKYCDLDPDGKAHTTQFGAFVGALTHARGVIYSVHAQDLLEGMGAVTPAEHARMDTFHHNMFDVIRSINNREYDVSLKWRYSDETYNNQSPRIFSRCSRFPACWTMGRIPGRSWAVDRNGDAVLCMFCEIRRLFRDGHQREFASVSGRKAVLGDGGERRAAQYPHRRVSLSRKSGAERA